MKTKKLIEESDKWKAEKKKHNGKRYDKSFKIAAVKLVTEKGYTPRRRRRGAWGFRSAR